MLKKIIIRNFALIEHAEVDFSSGFSVITGETGHGKSVFLGAISMLLGQRSDAKVVREGADRCVVESYFDISGFGLQGFFEKNELDYDNECIVRREVASNGRSRAFVNDSPVSVALLKELGSRLIDIHSQHQNLLLGDGNYQLSVLDTLACNKEQFAVYGEKYAAYVELRKEIGRMKAELEKNRNDEEWLSFQCEELGAAALKPGELEELEQEAQELSHAEEIQAALYGAYSSIDGSDGHTMLQALRDAATSLMRTSSHYPAAGELSERLESCYIELKDCCSELEQRAGSVQFAPERLDFVEQRIAQLLGLQKKHRVSSIEELIALYKSFTERLETITGGDDEIREAEKRFSELKSELAGLAGGITEVRESAANSLQQGMKDILVNLGMPMIRFEVEFTATDDFTSHGCDNVTFLFSANSSSRPQPLCDVASGGEMARVMLALKSIVASETRQPTVIFDEVDTGVSGVLAERMGRLMQQMAGENRQVISITHLPQVAALGAHHYKVYKEETEKGTITNMIKLEEQKRVHEIAQMMSGEVLTDAAVDNAALLLSKSKNYGSNN